MSSHLFQVFQYLNHVLKRKDEHALHSPFLFDFYRSTSFSCRAKWYDQELEKFRDALLQDEEEVERIDFGAYDRKKRWYKVSSIARRSLSSKEQNAFFAAAIDYSQSKYILEVGTSLGINTLYMAKACKDGQVVTLEGDPMIAKLATMQFVKAGNGRIQLLEGEFGQTLPEALSILPRLDFVFFDGNHRFAPTWHYFQQCLSKSHEESVFVFHDIYWSPEMLKLWKEVVKSEVVTLSIDFYHFGVLFFRTNQPKQHFYLKF